MKNRRTVVAVVVVLCTAVAVFLNIRFLRTADDRAFENAKTVDVLTVTGEIPRGMSAAEAESQGLIQEKKLPQEFRPETALTSLDGISNNVAVIALTPGQVVVSGLFVDPVTESITSSSRIGDGMVAVTVNVDEVHAVGGILQPGDFVNIMVNTGTDTAPQISVLYQNTRILFINQQAALAPGETPTTQPPSEDGTTAGLMTFEVPPQAASRLVYATLLPGGLYLSLVPPGYVPQSIEPIGGGNLLTGGLTPEG